MAGFDFVCPMHGSAKCNLKPEELQEYATSNGQKYGFLLYPFKAAETDPYLVDTIKELFFHAGGYTILDARVEPGLGIKICKICKLANVAEFGIAVLSPENYNVYLEVGLLWGMEKPVMLVVNENNLGSKPDGTPKTINDLAFDVSAYIDIKYSSKQDLLTELKREATGFLGKVKDRYWGGFQRDLVKSVKDRLRKLKEMNPQSIEDLRMILRMGETDFDDAHISTYMRVVYGNPEQFLANQAQRMSYLGAIAFIRIEPVPSSNARRYHFSPELLPILRQEAFKEIE